MLPFSVHIIKFRIRELITLMTFMSTPNRNMGRSAHFIIGGGERLFALKTFHTVSMRPFSADDQFMYTLNNLTKFLLVVVDQ
jgi:hypothetical protein